ncbi:hypothetical protein PIB30_056714 [Stylosanthes scabra]|uniref:Uncharacterized protein n=1 Tax=Stylosanthes scabra TaxID=79078 RepID=A0ABU6VHZ4_9FABA|nr:hypothetical protein [Stylosanthes scabra]
MMHASPNACHELMCWFTTRTRCYSDEFEYGFFTAPVSECASWQDHIIPHLLNVGKTTPPSPTLRRTDQAGRTTILVKLQRRNNIPHKILGSSSHQATQETQARHDPRPCSLSLCFVHDRFTQPETGLIKEPALSFFSLSSSISAIHRRLCPLSHREPSLTVIGTSYTPTFRRQRCRVVRGGPSLSCRR